MAYRKVDGSDKIGAVLAVMRGVGPSAAAREFGINRGTLYKLIGRARELIRCSLSRPTHTAGFKHARLEHRVRALAREADAAKRALRLCEAKLRKADRAVELVRNLGRPVRCRSCGCEKIYRNGSYRISHSNFCKRFYGQNGHRIEVRHYICAACNDNMYVVDPQKNIFYIDAPRGEGRGVVRHRMVRTPGRMDARLVMKNDLSHRGATGCDEAAAVRNPRESTHEPRGGA